MLPLLQGPSDSMAQTVGVEKQTFTVWPKILGKQRDLPGRIFQGLKVTSQESITVKSFLWNVQTLSSLPPNPAPAL